ncbi:MAG: SLC13 family permease [Candidatus Azobacteroides sp.]|nr:SLC13 family permease [Candidatus Azobacteroides sp.]
MTITLIILLLSAVFFVNGKIRSDLVALCALLLLLIFDILTPEEALSGFSNSIVIMMAGLFVVGGAIFQTGLAKMISSKILRWGGNSSTKLFILVMSVTSFIGAFVSNTGTVALMLPIVVSLALSADTNPGRFLMPMAFASSMGGMMTLIGTPPNLVIHNVLLDAGYEGLSFFSFLPVGLICIAIGILTLLPLSKYFLSKDDNGLNNGKKKHKSLKDLANEYQLSRNLFRLRVTAGSLLKNKNVRELDVRRSYKTNVLEIRRKPASQNPFFKTVEQKIVGPDTIILEGDILYVRGDVENVQRFSEDTHTPLIDTQEPEEVHPKFSGKLRFDKIGIAEVVLMPNSKLINRLIEESGFREKYHVNVLSIQRSQEYILQGLKDQKLKIGDVLLVQGEWADIDRLNEEQSEWVVVGQPSEAAKEITLDYKAPIAAVIMILMVLVMALNIMPAVMAVLIAAVLMVLSGCIRSVEDAYKTINWESIVLIAAMLPMASALEKTGASTTISSTLVSGLGGFGPVILLAGIYFATSLTTMFISNTATAVLFAPIALHSAIGSGVSPYPFLFAVAVAASMCFASPFSTPPNALVMSAGRYTFADYIKVGLPLQIIVGIVMILVLPLLFRF